jgi:hypothetical protein
MQGGNQLTFVLERIVPTLQNSTVIMIEAICSLKRRKAETVSNLNKPLR